MQQPIFRCPAAIASVFLLMVLLLFGSFTPATNYDYDIDLFSRNFDANASKFTFFEDFETWIQKGYEQYAEPLLNESVTQKL